MLIGSVFGAATLFAIALIVYHHLAWPAMLARFRRRHAPAPVPPRTCGAAAPRITVVMPAHNEADFIAAKIRNLAALDYPAEVLSLVVACDGCTDATAALARAALAEPACTHLNAYVIEHRRNRGKVAVLNEAIAGVKTEIVALTDVSAMLPADALCRVAAHFTDPNLGALGGTYVMDRPGSAGEAKYWTYQVAVKLGEAALGAPLGLHGAFWAFRRAAWTPLPVDTINDDFALPMAIFRRGWRIAYDPGLPVHEAESADPAAERRRRRRIAAGNAQQLLRHFWLLHPRHGGVALAFASGKALRVMMPFLIAFTIPATFALAPTSQLFVALAACEAAGIVAAAAGAALGQRAPRPLAILHYAAAGHAASLVGAARYILLHHRQPWGRAALPPAQSPGRSQARRSLSHWKPQTYLPPHVVAAKRTVDIVAALAGLVLTAPLWPAIMLAIRLDSPGPALFRQLRIGRMLPDHTELFWILKFRTMRIDAEAQTGAVWAGVDDPRATRVGRFLRRTRLDELPQFINVLRGEMSIIGPRPERPAFYGRLERAIPFFADRTLGLRPGLTGLAQVSLDHGTTLEILRSKASYDHAYAMMLTSLHAWLKQDLRIVVRTMAVMAARRGQ